MNYLKIRNYDRCLRTYNQRAMMSVSRWTRISFRSSNSSLAVTNIFSQKCNHQINKIQHWQLMCASPKCL